MPGIQNIESQTGVRAHRKKAVLFTALGVVPFFILATVQNGKDNRKYENLKTAELEGDRAEILGELATATFTVVHPGEHLDAIAGTPDLFKVVDSNFHNGFREELGRNGYGPDFLKDTGYTALLLKPASCGETAMQEGYPNVEVMHIRDSANVSVDYTGGILQACNTDPAYKNVVVVKAPVLPA